MEKMRRREFLGSAVGGTAGVLLAGSMVQAAPAKAAKGAAKSKVNPTALVPLGKSLKVCRIGAGTGMDGGMRLSNQVRLGREKFEALLRYQYDQNVRLFDCADLYGTHPYVGRVLKSKPRDSYQVFSKIWFLRGGLPESDRPDADVCVKRFLKELQVEYIDLVQMHCMMSPDWPSEMRKQMDIMEKLKQQGLIRAHGVSVHTLAALKTAAEEPWVDAIHVRINKFNKHMGDSSMGRAVTTDDVVPLLQAAHKAGKGIIGMKLCGQGELDAQQREASIQWVMGLGCVDVLIAGFEKPEQVDEIKTLVQKKLMAMAEQRPRQLASA